MSHVYYLPIVFLILIRVFAADAAMKPPTSRSSVFADIKTGKRLELSSLLQATSVNSVSKCALECNRNDKCLSFGFCDVDVCQLYDADVYSTEYGEDILVNDPKCRYLGMTKVAKPICQHEGRFEDVQSQNNSEFCLLKEKRVDQKWGAWVEGRKSYNGVDWKEYNVREVLIEAAHGGAKNNDVSEKLVYWIKFVNKRMI